ncbi:hypothetical protein ACFQV2_24630 [Actinokineospora soli]|uniref:Carboxymuconolactone decarboxylase family protein n=1 Tax=Actinokineospora soli TaxID=1048753 RepID=A0ABW2TS61_9PSEU
MPEAPTTLLFVKRAGLGEVHAARINAATALVLACCTGQAPVREVVFAVAAGLGARAPLDLAALERGVRASLAALARLGAVGFRGGAP